MGTMRTRSNRITRGQVFNVSEKKPNEKRIKANKTGKQEADSGNSTTKASTKAVDVFCKLKVKVKAGQNF